MVILGTGDIGSSLARRLRGFNCTVIGLCRRPRPITGFDQVSSIEAGRPACPGRRGGMRPAPYGKNRRSARPTAAIFDEARGDFGQLRPGSLIDLAALAEAMDAVPLLGCALDVTSPEPLPPESPLWDMERMIVTPHVSGASFGHLPETEDKIYRLAADNLERYLEDKPLRNLVDFSTGYRIL